MTAKSKINFNESYRELQRIVAWFEKDDFDVEEGIEKFETGTKLVKELKLYLDTMENKVKELKRKIKE